MQVLDIMVENSFLNTPSYRRGVPFIWGTSPKAVGRAREARVTEALHTGCHDHLALDCEGTTRADRRAGPDSPQR